MLTLLNYLPLDSLGDWDKGWGQGHFRCTSDVMVDGQELTWLCMRALHVYVRDLEVTRE